MVHSQLALQLCTPIPQYSSALQYLSTAQHFSTSVPLLSRWMCENGTGTPVMLQQRVRVLALLKALVAELLQQAVSSSQVSCRRTVW